MAARRKKTAHEKKASTKKASARKRKAAARKAGSGKKAKKRATKKKARRKKARAATGGGRKRSPAAAAAASGRFVLRTDSSEFAFETGTKLQQLAMRWAYILRQRRRWTERPGDQRELERRAERDLGEIGIDGAALDAIADTDVVEVSIPYAAEDVAWEARILPWEYVLTAATRSRRHGKPEDQRRLLVVRHLDGGATGTMRAPGSLLLFESAPGAIQESYDFSTERERVQRHLAFGPDRTTTLRSVSQSVLSETVRRKKPDVIHIMGVDAHQGATFLPADEVSQEEDSDDSWDGIYIADGDGRPTVVRALPLAQALNPDGGAGAHHPVLVACNTYNSASRIAALAVGAGAGAGLGIQDQIDDDLAELFFATFYREWKRQRWDLLGAFQAAFGEISGHRAAIRGSGLVLWSSRPLVRLARPRVPAPPKLEELTARDLTVDVTPMRELNYSLLHNGRSPFERFSLALSGHGILRHVDVEATFWVGSDQFPYRRRLDLTQEVRDIASEIRVPLTWNYVESMREATRTTVHASVSVGNDLVYSDTQPVTLLPVNEWRDTQRDARWLPSFVLPRDPAVLRIVDQAQRYLGALADDPMAGFEGYQCLERDPEDLEGVDNQVRALWSAILTEHRLGYINPPPTYTQSSQRLRTPSGVIDGGRGTCIDLALLFAACLEYVEIYPVLFLLQGHACPGYWRTHTAYEEFSLPRLPEAMEPQEPTRTELSEEPFVLRGEDVFEELHTYIDEGLLVPLETVYLTEQRGLFEAEEGGLENLESFEDFDACIELMRARQEGVTPILLQGAR